VISPGGSFPLPSGLAPKEQGDKIETVEILRVGEEAENRDAMAHFNKLAK